MEPDGAGRGRTGPDGAERGQTGPALTDRREVSAGAEEDFRGGGKHLQAGDTSGENQEDTCGHTQAGVEA